MERCKNHLPFRTWIMEKWNVSSRIFLQTLETQMTSLAYLLVLEDPYLVFLLSLFASPAVADGGYIVLIYF